MSESLPRYVLDSFALLAHFEAEAGGELVRELLERARDQKIHLALSLINAGELYYITYREQGATRGEEILKDLRALPIQWYDVSEERVLAAAKFKAEHPISYADAFAVALANELKATLVTGDRELWNLRSLVPVMWLTRNAH